MTDTVSDRATISPSIADIERALRAHVNRGPRPEAIIRDALYPLGSAMNSVQMDPGAGTARPTYSLRVPALGLTIDRQSVKRVAQRLHEISTALADLPIGERAGADAMDYLVTHINAEARLRAANDDAVRAAMRALCTHQIYTVHVAVPNAHLEDACRTALSWAQSCDRLPAGPLRLVQSIRLFLDRARLVSTEAAIGLPGVQARITLPLTELGAPGTELEEAPSAHAHIKSLACLRVLGEVLVQDRDTWLGQASAGGATAVPATALHLTIRISTRAASPEIRLTITDREGRRIEPAEHDRSAELHLDSSIVQPRSLLHALKLPGTTQWMVDLSAKPGAPPVRFAGTSLAEALATGSPDGRALDHAALSHLAGRVATHRAARPDMPIAFQAIAKPG